VYEHRRAESLRIVAETDTKRTKISELIDYIDSRLTELEEEKEELREFQEQDKDRRCIEYALYLRELDEVAQTLVEIDEDRRGEVHGANQRREQFTDRQKEMQVCINICLIAVSSPKFPQRLEKRVSDIENELQTVAVTRNGAQSELTDLVGTRTELQCIVDDLRSAGALAGGKRTKIEAELATLARQISAREDELRELLPDWENRRMQEGGEKRRLEEADTKLKALFAKQGRMKRFRTKAERDVYLRGEIASIQAYQDSQTSALEATRADLAASRKSQAELEQNIVAVHGRIEDGRKRVKDLIDQALQLKDQHARLTERRKELWREDTKHDTLVKQALEQMKKAEGVLATLMDKVRTTVEQTLRARLTATHEGYRSWSPCR
jgi:structural maintenance of chromosome 3 (chondroitin sulfate proteoglycan 6)